MEFHVTKEIFQDVKNGTKLNEYRDYKTYWKNRLEKIVVPEDGFIVEGYTKNKIPITIMEINVMHKMYIKNKVYRSFIKPYFCFDIRYKIKNCKGKFMENQK